MTREEKERLLVEIEKEYKWLLSAETTTYNIDIAFDAIRKAVRDEAEQEPKISLDTYKQVTKERDIAIEQLHELGYEFGEKIEPTTKNDLAVDCIDRAELLKAMDTWDKFGYTARHGLERLDKDDKGFVPYVKYKDMVNCVKGAPSVTPQEPRWIPVSERLPEPQVNGGDKDLSEWVLVSLSTSNFDTVCGAFYCFSEKKWYRERVAFGTVTAWMPLPKPYKAESEEI